MFVSVRVPFLGGSQRKTTIVGVLKNSEPRSPVSIGFWGKVHGKKSNLPARSSSFLGTLSWSNPKEDHVAGVPEKYVLDLSDRRRRYAKRFFDYLRRARHTKRSCILVSHGHMVQAGSKPKPLGRWVSNYLDPKELQFTHQNVGPARMSECWSNNPFEFPECMGYGLKILGRIPKYILVVRS